MNEYIQHLDGNIHIDATVVGKNALFANDSCNPNCKVSAVELGRTGYYVFWMQALRTIEPGQELKSDYGWEKSDKDVLVILECRDSNFKGFIEKLQ